MAKQTIYLKDEIEDKIREISNNEGRPISEVIRRRIEASFQQEELIDRLEDKINSIYSAIQIIAGDLGYVAGATRASTKSNESIKIAGAAHELTIKQILNSMGKHFLNEEEKPHVKHGS